MILALDTTGEHGSLALLGDGVAAEWPMHAPDGFGHMLFGELRDFLRQQGVPLSVVTCFAAASGPGSFTGVRVGLAAVKGLAEAEGKPAVAVSALRAMAAFGSGARRVPILDARRGEVFAAVYDSRLSAVTAETVGPLDEFLKRLPPGDVEFIAWDFSLFEARLPANGVRTMAPTALALAVARIASLETPGDPAALDANYVRRSDAELFWKEPPA